MRKPALATIRVPVVHVFREAESADGLRRWPEIPPRMAAPPAAGRAAARGGVQRPGAGKKVELPENLNLRLRRPVRMVEVMALAGPPRRAVLILRRAAVFPNRVARNRPGVSHP
jgi:hypothetical protein